MSTSKAKDHAISSVLHMSHSDFRGVMKSLKGSKSKHAPEARKSRNKRHLASKMIGEGGGFSKMVGAAVNLTNPWHWASTFNTWQHSLTQNERMTENDHDMAWMADQAYKEVGARTGAHGWQYLEERSDEIHAVFARPSGGVGPGKRDQYLLSIRGTAGVDDLLPDVFLALGKQDESKDFQQSLQKAQRLQEELPGEWSVGGHSLGGTKAMWVAQATGVTSYAFNPGFHSAADDIIDTGYEGHNLYVVRGDPVSNTILARENPNLKIVTTDTFDPLTNHRMSNFVEPTRQTQPDTACEIAAAQFKRENIPSLKTQPCPNKNS